MVLAVDAEVGQVVAAARPGDDANTLVSRADAALYAAKGDGRNSWRVSVPDEAERVVA